MSSAETPNNNKRISLSNSFSEDQGYHGGIPEHEESMLKQIETYKIEVNRLKYEKLELLRQNVVSVYRCIPSCTPMTAIIFVV